MAKRRSFVMLFMLICVLALSSKCNGEFCGPPDKIDLEEILPLSKSISADVFYDASFSMVGFVSNINSYYVRTLQLVESSLISGWTKQAIKYFKFGTIAREIPRAKALEATQGKFYIDDEFKNETHIEKVIARANTGHLTIIVTDLFQNNADVNLLIQKLNEKFLSKKLSVGILAVKSEFTGRVWDVGIHELNFDYTTAGLRPEHYRPFYILMLGKYAEIEHFYKNIKANGLASFPQTNFIILSPNLVRRLASFENLTSAKSKKLVEVTSLIRPFKRYDGIKQFVVKSEGAFFEPKIKLARLVDAPLFNPKNLEAEVQALKWHPKKKNFKECLQARKALHLKNFNISGAELGFKADINQSNLEGKGIYSFECIIRPCLDAYDLPAWISGWDMDVDMLNQWIENPDQFNGAATLNLKFFVNTIWRIIAQEYRPKIARLHLYIKK